MTKTSTTFNCLTLHFHKAKIERGIRLPHPYSIKRSTDRPTFTGNTTKIIIFSMAPEWSLSNKLFKNSENGLPFCKKKNSRVFETFYHSFYIPPIFFILSHFCTLAVCKTKINGCTTGILIKCGQLHVKANKD